MLLLAEAGRILSAADPGRALAWNPFHAETRLAVMAALVSSDPAGQNGTAIMPGPGPGQGQGQAQAQAQGQGTGPASLPQQGSEADGAQTVAEQASNPQLAAVLRTGYEMHPEDARFASALASQLAAAGDLAGARTLFSEALAEMPTEGGGLVAKVLFSSDAGDWEQAINALELLAVRHPQQLTTVLPIVEAMIAQPELRDRLITGLADRPSARERIVALLMNQPGALPAAADLLLRWNTLQALDSTGRRQASQLASQLLQQGAFDSAILLDRLLFDRGEDVAGGFINNGAFSAEPSGSPFDWSFPRTRGVAIDRMAARDAADLSALFEKNAGASQGPDPALLRLTFLDTPVQMRSVVQNLAIPGGAYRLSILGRRSPAHLAPATAPIKIELWCKPSERVLATITLSDLPVDWTAQVADFVIDTDNGCARQEIGVRNPFIAQSWQNRYTGWIDLALVRLERMEPGP